MENSVPQNQRPSWRKSSEGTFCRHAQSEVLAVKELQK